MISHRTHCGSICRSPAAGWQQEVANAVTDPAELCRLLALPSSQVAEVRQAASAFPLRVPRPYLDRIRPGDPRDPLLLQVLPRVEELQPAAGFVADPVAETPSSWGRGLVRKYAGRLLMVPTWACAVHCRYCFRRHLRHRPAATTPELWEAACRRIRADASLREIILSGGDPLSLGDEALAELVELLAKVAHIKRLRIHTRMPVVVPSRVTDSLVRCLAATRLNTLVVLHVNHPAELAPEVTRAVARLVDAGIPVLNQSVLLRGVNDSVQVLAELCERLVDGRVLPYYLHQLDRVAGTAHFEVPEAAGKRLIEALRARLPGYAVPRYVVERPGQSSKVVLA